jgi:hypothetical protein
MRSTTGTRFWPLSAWILVSVAVHGEPSLREALANHYVITKVSNDGSVITAGSWMALHKDGLIMFTIGSPQPSLATWKDGKMAMSISRNIAIGVAIRGNGVADLPKRKFVPGELLWLIGIAVEKDAVVFRLLSDAFNGIHYCADLKFPFPKGGPPTYDQAVRQIDEVISVQAPDKPATETAPLAAPAPAQAPTSASVPEPAAPAQVQTVSLGDTPERVIAALGQPRNIVKLGVRQIYIYPNLKVTFENGKVTDVQ